jgi:hypothetical protein
VDALGPSAVNTEPSSIEEMKEAYGARLLALRSDAERIALDLVIRAL